MAEYIWGGPNNDEWSPVTPKESGGFDDLKNRRMMDEHCPSFWRSHKQYLLSFDTEEMELVEFLVLKSYLYGKGDRDAKLG